MITHTTTRPITRWQASDSQVFELKATYEQSNESWARYTNAQGQEFTCRLEAFEARFTPLVD